MSVTMKRVLFATGCLIIWLGFVFSSVTFATLVVSIIGGWTLGGWIFDLSAKVFPD